MKAKTIKKWFDVHKWTSLICTVFLLMLCLTGLPLIFYEEIDHLLGRELELPAVAPGTPAISKDVVLEEAVKQVPVKAVKYVSWDLKEHPGQMFVVVADSSEAPVQADHYLTMNEYTAKVMATPPNEMDFMLVMYYLHVEMLAGIPGKLFLGLMGLLFIVAIVSGVVLYGPIMRRFDFGMIRTEKSLRLRWLDLHNLLGIVTLAWASVVGLTGVINTLVDPALDRWKASQLAEMVAGYKDKPKVTGTLSSLDAAVKTAKAAAPGMDVSFVAYPGTLYSSKYHYAVYMTGTTPLTSRIIKPALIDAKTGELTAIRDLPWYLKTIFISQPFHFGDYGGMPMKVLWAIFDIATIIVLISGIYLWLARRKSRSAQLKRLTGESGSLTLSTVHENAEKK
ncbi:PepSY-associated TM helix domain-containing protein [Pedobacter heparinus]|uniref:PepSY-associated TM helix domain protein n=1 Tax=Pedobacter heparinus (strain ATCC 13125 / DSM 2366 / CIP 104194 / JCM 7457 / NBRC 12017 / NCIMB 9290 / NRRL B-14731 / HIM 762-3) TaxID=485917 RepID=C6Y246_PEDHD|nr:PepSY domain-containing protein [Pedobacter heparinus]ACU03039.1 PepSY-associated TM helix domain protein [Pedobacter heparinus DSM 2366]